MMEAPESEVSIENLFRDAARWRLLGLLFEPPEGTWREQVENIAREIGDPDYQAVAALAIEEASPGLYHGTLGPGGPASPRAVTYDRAIQPGQRLAELAALYQAFGYLPALCEAPDHVAIETGFVAYLRLKEAYAVARGDIEHAEITRDAARQFITVQLAPIIQPLAERLSEGAIPYLAQAATLLLESVENAGTEHATNDCAPAACRVEAGLGMAGS